MNQLKLRLLALAASAVLLLSGCTIEFVYDDESSLPQQSSSQVSQESTSKNEQDATVDLADIPEFSGEPYVEINGNEPQFTEDQFNADAFEYYSELDALGRCGVVYANISRKMMPTEDRESISNVKPSGWINVPYDFVDGKYLYNRCHLIGFQLTGENANEKNLITGTRYMNVEGMLPFENMVADYIKETDDNVLYRVTPIYEGDNLVASGVQMEAISVSDRGESICFNVYCYNNQPGVIIDYKTGESKEDLSAFEDGEKNEYVINTNNGKFHLPSCSGVADMNPKNKQEFTGSRDLLIAQGYEPCGRCDP